MKEYLDIDELSRLIHLSKSQLYMMTSTKKIPFLKVGRRVLFDPDQIEHWLSARAVVGMEVTA